MQLHNTPTLKLQMDIKSYISGYVDGEGCFCVSFQPSKRHLLGWEVRPSFSVSQNGDRAQLLYQIKEMWRCGSIRPDRSDRTLKFEVRNIEALLSTVVPHFESFPLLSSKQLDFEIFAQVCRLIGADEHRNKFGFSKIVKLAHSMNPSGKRKFSENEILSSFSSDECIVYATGNRG